MSTPVEIKPNSDLELAFCKILNAPREKVFQCWTQPELITKWFTPPPWKTTHAEIDLRAGGANLITMTGPNGEEMPNRGVYLEVKPNEKLVFTDAFTKAWQPSSNPFMAVTLTFEDAGAGKTKYTVRVNHWKAEDCQQHLNMGFYQGWGIATDQLEALASKL